MEDMKEMIGAAICDMNSFVDFLEMEGKIQTVKTKLWVMVYILLQRFCCNLATFQFYASNANLIREEVFRPICLAHDAT